ncbi:MAG: TonB-dependent receptor [Prevotellaceae bacterium]|nr:TonB-dependent receptor [Prevotellaceae bacterium]
MLPPPVQATAVQPADTLQRDTVNREGGQLEQVSVRARKMGTMKMRSSLLNEEVINQTELLRAACCNLGESFTTNPSVDVNYSDAATGAKQIKLLGLSGTYVQLLTENIPNYRGAAAPYALGYIPGTWMQSIQVSKGAASVKNGYEAMTGQINVEFKKPQQLEADLVSANLFGNTAGRIEANADATIGFRQGWGTTLLLHYENDTQTHDADGDGFLDMPRVEQYHLGNRWTHTGGRTLTQFGVKALHETRSSGQTAHIVPGGNDRYTIGIRTNRAELFAKHAYLFNKEHNTNLGVIVQGTLHRQEASYGRRRYHVDQRTAYASLMLESELDTQHSLSVGASFHYDHLGQDYRLEADASQPLQRDVEKEAVPGAYVQYTYNLNDRLVVMGGLRADYSNRYGFFVTPRAHLKYTPGESFYLRLSAGKGYRTAYPLAEHHNLLAGSRRMQIEADLQQEQAWNYGASASAYLPLGGKTLQLNVEYYYTDFHRQVVVDMESEAHAILFYNLEGRSYSHSFQAEASYPFFRGFTLTAAYRLTDAQTTYHGKRMQKPLTSRYKGLLTASYQTPLGLWQADATLQLNGGGRMPTPYQTAQGILSWQPSFGAYGQLSAQLTRYFRNWSVYLGGENLTGFRQRDPLIGANNPWGETFDATMVWGPLQGARAYIGIRFNLPRHDP